MRHLLQCRWRKDRQSVSKIKTHRIKIGFQSSCFHIKWITPSWISTLLTCQVRSPSSSICAISLIVIKNRWYFFWMGWYFIYLLLSGHELLACYAIRRINFVSCFKLDFIEIDSSNLASTSNDIIAEDGRWKVFWVGDYTQLYFFTLVQNVTYYPILIWHILFFFSRSY